MSTGEPRDLSELKVDASNLYREETFTDLKLASIRRLTPVKADGTEDAGRQPIFLGEASVITRAGPVPVQCRIEATSLQEAMEKFPEAIQEAVAQMIEEVREFQRQQASRIVVPTAAPPNLTGGPGGMKGGPGKIKLP